MKNLSGFNFFELYLMLYIATGIFGFIGLVNIGYCGPRPSTDSDVC